MQSSAVDQKMELKQRVSSLNQASTVLNVSGISVKTKIIIFVTILLIIILCFYFYNKSSQPSSTTSAQTLKKMIDTVKAGQVQLYLYSPMSQELYMKDQNGDYWDAGPGSQCPTLVQNAIVIKDVVQIFNCNQIPSQYQSNCYPYNNDPTKYVPVTIQTAQDVESDIVKNIKGPYTPTLTSCFATSSPTSSGTGGTGGINPNLNPINILQTKYQSFPDYCQTKKDEILENLKETALQLGEMVAAAKVVGSVAGEFFAKWVILFWILPSIIHGTGGQRMQGIVMGSYVGVEQLVEYATKLISEKIAARTPEQISKTVEEADGQIAESTTKELTEIGMDVLLDSLNAIFQILSKFMTIIGVLMIAGMIVDVFDPCSLNSGNLAQANLDDMKQGYEQAYTALTGGISYPTIWDASKICAYNLDSSNYWKNCLTDAEQKDPNNAKYKDQMDADKKLLLQYSKEYQNALTTNSQGESLQNGPMNISNQALQKIMETAVPEADWSALGSISKDDVTSVLPQSLLLKNLDMLFTSGNVIEAKYVSQNWFIFLVIIVIILAICFFL